MSSYATVAGSKPASSTSTPIITPTSSTSDMEQRPGNFFKQASSDHAAALAKRVSFYERKTRQIHQAMLGIWNGSHTFQQTAAYHGYTLEELGTAFAIFGVQAMEIIQQQNVYKDTAFRAMALNKDGYSTEIEYTLPKAFRQKKAEAEAGGREALFRQVQGQASGGKELPYRSVAASGGFCQPGRGKLPLPKLPGNK